MESNLNLGAGGDFTKFSVGGSRAQYKNEPNRIIDFGKMRSQKVFSAKRGS